MPYRRLDLLASDLTIDDIASALGDYEPADLFLTKRNDGMDLATIVLNETYTEPVTDALEKRFGKRDHFQLLVYDIAARLPRPTQEEKDEQDAQDAKDKPESKARISREELLNDLEPGSRIRGIYLAQVVISCIVAAVGMIRDSVALVIAAMVIAPLLLPSMSMALGTTIGDLRMIGRSVLTSVAGVAVGLALSVVIGFFVPFDPQVNEIANRAMVSYTDLVVALAAGAAGALAVTTGVSASLIGVMVAVALVPPLVAAGLFLGDGDFSSATNAAILLAANIVCVNLAAMGVFLIQGVRPSKWAEKNRAKLAVRHAFAVWLVLLVALVLLIAFAVPKNLLK